MRMYLDTSTSVVNLRLDDITYTHDFGRQMAKDLLPFIRECLAQQNADWQDLDSITFFTGPGSFTGLRIGASIVNALADQLNIDLYDQDGVKHLVILPVYGRPANITSPKR